MCVHACFAVCWPYVVPFRSGTALGRMRKDVASTVASTVSTVGSVTGKVKGSVAGALANSIAAAAESVAVANAVRQPPDRVNAFEMIEQIESLE